MNAGIATLLLVGGWLLIGAGTGVALQRRGHPTGTAISALMAWPALIPLFDGVSPTGTGPHHAQIVAAFQALTTALNDPAASAVVDPASILHLRDALMRADARIAIVERLLGDPTLAADESTMRLRAAHVHAVQEIQDALRGVIQLRVQLGLLALLGDTGPARAQLDALAARVRALEEVSLPATHGATVRRGVA